MENFEVWEIKSGKKSCWGTAIIPANDTEKAEMGRENYKNGFLCTKVQRTQKRFEVF